MRAATRKTARKIQDQGVVRGDVGHDEHDVGREDVAGFVHDQPLRGAVLFAITRDGVELMLVRIDV